ncbi:MAG: hypothetical protein AAB355_03255, partial [Patescibacteria group bacterium]
MIDFQARKKIRRVLYSPFTLIIMIVFLAIFSRAAYFMWQREHEASDALSNLEKEREILKAKQEALTLRIASLKTERGVEAALREKYKVAKDGEEVVVIVDKKKDSGDIIMP